MNLFNGSLLALIEAAFERAFNTSGKIPTYGLATRDVFESRIKMLGKPVDTIYLARTEESMRMPNGSCYEINGVPIFCCVERQSEGELQFCTGDIPTPVLHLRPRDQVAVAIVNLHK